jgi:uncharacterized membrane protein YhaH (DUF805 family)
MLNDIFRFSGRISRGQFIMSLFWLLGVAVIFALIQSYYLHNLWLGLVVFGLIIIVYYAQLVKRLHDIGKPGWLAIIGHTVIICIFKEGDEGENEYGPDPRLHNVI